MKPLFFLSPDDDTSSGPADTTNTATVAGNNDAGDSGNSSDAGTVTASSPNAIQFDVAGTIPVIAQPKSMACWATVTAMLMSWKQQQSMTIETAMDSLGSDFRKIFDDNTGLAPDRVQDLATATGMTIEYQKCETPQSILQLLQSYGPISIVDNEGSTTNSAVHNRIIQGIYGDGTIANTFLKIIDPDGGQTYNESFDTFASKYEGMSEANGWNLQMMHY